MSVIRFFVLTFRSVAIFCGLIYLISILWNKDRSPVRSKSEIAVGHLEVQGIELSSSSVSDAVRGGDLRNLKLLGLAGVDFDQRDGGGRLARHIAIESEQWDALKIVEQYSADVSEEGQGEQGFLSSVNLLIEKGQFELAQQYLQRGAEIQFKDQQGSPVLMNCLYSRDFQAFDFFLKNGADPNVIDEDGKLPIQLAFELGLTDCVLRLLKEGAMAENLSLGGVPVISALIKSEDRYGVSDELVSVVLSDLIKAGAKADAVDSKTRERPIITAIKGGDRLMLDLLLEQDVETSGCLELVLGREDLTMLRSLFRAGVLADEKLSNGQTALVSLVRSGGNLELIKTFLDHGANPNQFTKEGQTILFFALARGDTKRVLALLSHERRPDLNILMKFPVSAEFRALYGKKGLMDWYCKNVRELSPLMLAILSQNIEVAEKMIGLGVKSRRRSAGNIYPIQVAAQTQNVAMQQLVLGVPHLASQQQRKFVIDLSEQTVYFYKSGNLIKKTRCSTGKSGYRTRKGEFVITDKEKNKVSNIYKDAKMPYFQRFSCGDFGFHQGNTGSRFASHGCIRLPMSVAKFFFSHSKIGDRVVIRE